MFSIKQSVTRSLGRLRLPHYSLRAIHTQRFHPQFRRLGTFRTFATFIGGAALAFTSAQVLNSSTGESGPIRLDAVELSSAPIKSVELESVLFPVSITRNGEKYSLLGTGVRTISFLSFKVYVLGIYIATRDKAKAKAVLGGSNEDELLDPDNGSALISKLLNSDIKFDIRIVPVRNTDFGHMRDGFVRTIMAHPRFKIEGNNSEEFGEGISEFKRVFSRKRNVPKHTILHLNRNENGTLSVDFYDAKDEVKVETEHLGTVSNPLVSELLFLQYLSGKKPSSESARQSAVKVLANL